MQIGVLAFDAIFAFVSSFCLPEDYTLQASLKAINPCNCHSGKSISQVQARHRGWSEYLTKIQYTFDIIGHDAIRHFKKITV